MIALSCGFNQFNVLLDDLIAELLHLGAKLEQSLDGTSTASR